MIALTGASGKTGLAIVHALARRGQSVRALVRRESDQVKVITAAGGKDSEAIQVEFLVGDMSDRATIKKLLEGASALYHICPNMHPDEVGIGATILECAQEVGLQHLVYHSVLHPQTSAMPHHWHKLRVEEMIFASGIPFTLLQPTAYMQNLLAYWREIGETGRYIVPYPVNTRLSLVNLEDVAKVAARILTEPGHTGATYELVGTRALTQVEVAEIMSAHLGFRVTTHELPLEQWEEQARRQGLSGYALETLLAMFRYYASYGLVGNPHVLSWLLGRQPTTLDTFIKETLINNAAPRTI